MQFLNNCTGTVKIYLLLIILCSCVAAVSAQTKHALIIAIGKYPEQGGWHEIAGKKDVPYVQATLVKQGFDQNNIHILLDDNVTPSGIEKAFSRLTQQVADGDIVVIHVSTHGEQVEDDNNDEIDGLDETIATYHAIIPSKSKDFSKDQLDYFRDDQFGSYISKLRSKLGSDGDIAVFMDLCHSGTATRGIAKVRGGQPALVSNHFRTKTAFDTSSVFIEKIKGLNETAMAPYVVISAARAEELSYETVDDNNEEVGALSYALSKAFENLQAGTTYRSLFSKIQTIMDIKMLPQHPSLEGNGADRELLGGKFVDQKPYIEIDKIRGNKLLIKAGLLAGLDSGARVALFPQGTINSENARLLALGTVVKAATYTSTIELDRDPGIKQAASGWVFITEPVYKMKPVRVGIDERFSLSEINQIKNNLQHFPLVQFRAKPEIMIVKGINNDSLIISATGHLFRTIKNAPSNTHNLREEIQTFLQYKFLKEIQLKDSALDVEVKIVPFIDGKFDTAKIYRKMLNGMFQLKDGDTCKLLIRNNSVFPIYCNVLDMQPDGVINAVFPNRAKGITPAELKVKPRAAMLSETIEIRPPLGTEVLKIFVSKKEIDMEAIAKSRGENTRGNFGVLEQLLQDSYRLNTRGTGTQALSTTDGSVFNLLFEITAKD